MTKEDNKKEPSKKKISFIGKKLLRQDKRCYNFKQYIKKHDVCIEIIFLMVYVFLNICLILTIRDRKISLFVVVLLFFISLERIIVHLKMRLERANLQNRENLIKQELREYDNIFYKTKGERDKFKIQNRTLKKQKEYLLKELKNVINELNKKG